MATIATSDTFIFAPDHAQETEQNLDEIFKCIRNTLGNRMDFSIRLEVASTEEDRQQVKKMLEFANDVYEEAGNIDSRKNAMVPVGIDNDNAMLYKMKKDLGNEDSDS